MLTIVSSALPLIDWRVRKKIRFEGWVESREVGDSVERGESPVEDFSLSTALWMCTLGSWKGVCELYHLWKSNAEILVDGLWVQVIKWKRDLLWMTVQLMRVMSQDPHWVSAFLSRFILSEERFCVGSKIPWFWWHTLPNCSMWSQEPNSSYIHLIHKY